MNRSVTGLSVHPLPKKPLILHLLSYKSTRDANLFSPHYYLQRADRIADLDIINPQTAAKG